MVGRWKREGKKQDSAAARRECGLGNPALSVKSFCLSLTYDTRLYMNNCHSKERREKKDGVSLSFGSSAYEKFAVRALKI